MRTDKLMLAFAYVRLSQEEAQEGESGSIRNQRQYISDYCERNGITLLQTFSDDGWSGGNFQRPGFQNMLEELKKGKANLVITKDLSRLGRDMREVSFYSEQYFPERGIRYIAIADNFDTEHENVMAPFLFAMNEVYLRDGSRKVREVLRNKREHGKYCACPPYGYKKARGDKNQLVADEITAPVVQRIFLRAAAGDSCRKIALDLNQDGIIPPLKYRVLYRDDFSEQGASHASDLWNYTTVKRILKNTVYLGHTTLGRSKKASVKSKVKLAVPKDEWVVTKNTHDPLVTQEQFQMAQKYLAKGTSDFRQYEHVRKNIFSGIAVCGRCGKAMCSCGTVYKGEREKYWYLACNHQRKDIPNPCEGARIKYADLVELVRKDLGSLIALSEQETEDLVQRMVQQDNSAKAKKSKKLQLEKAQARLQTIDKMIAKLYLDNAQGKLDDDRLSRLVAEMESEANQLTTQIKELTEPETEDSKKDSYDRFFELIHQYTNMDVLTRDILTTFVDRIEVYPKVILPDEEGKIPKSSARKMAPFTQEVRIFYRFIGEIQTPKMAET